MEEPELPQRWVRAFMWVEIVGLCVISTFAALAWLYRGPTSALAILAFGGTGCVLGYCQLRAQLTTDDDA